LVRAITRAGRVSGTTALTNQPRDRYSFGLASGYISSIGDMTDHPRVSIQNNTVASNPFPRSITMGVVNLPLWGYDASRFEMSWAERIRPFVGVPFAPDFGFAVGGSYAFTRTLAVNVGWARLWYDEPGDNEHLGMAPVNPDEPFQLASTGVVFVAAGFNFK
jgi:hypothetical protein